MEIVEILPLEYEPAPAAQAERLAAQQGAEREAKNQASLLAWHEHTFGPVVGPIINRGNP